mgnify:CR=1 FL=1|tara:strand:- start:1717 stop:2397 length:681 start_codon:yes stop_codon:yes gene_type:complete
MEVAGIDITIKRSDRKTVSIFVERDGTVSALVPETLEPEIIKEVLASKSYQIHKNLAEWEQLNERHVLREYVSGQSFLYLGRNYRLKLVDSTLGKLVFNQNTFYLGRDEVIKGDDYFIEFYKGKLDKRLQKLVPFYENRLGVESTDFKVMELQNRWASCTKKGNVNFHWKCAMAPIDVLHYIVAHELAHITHMNHTTAFWNEVDKVIPNYSESLHWLKYNGAGMTL